MNILFSPIGGTDPISNFRDGAMLHICRYYKPEKVILYLSKEMCEFHDKDNRYLYCIERLGKKLEHKFEVELVRRDDLEEVQVFDSFIEEFRNIWRKIAVENPDGKLFVNVSSGTPAMKSALLMLSILSEGNLIPIQVSTPVKRINPHSEDRIDYDFQTYWELNGDNEDDSENRCSVASNHNWILEIKKEVAIKHIEAYDYVAAIRELSENLHEGNPVFHLLEAASARMKMDFSGMQQQLNKLPFECDFLPVKDSQIRSLVEYTLGLVIKQRKQELADLVRAISPLLMDLYLLILDAECKLDIQKDYADREDKKIDKTVHYYWNIEKVNQNRAMREAFEQEYRDGLRRGELTNASVRILIEYLCGNESTRSKVQKLGTVEKWVRNLAAHEIASITDESIQKKAGITSKQLVDMIRSLVDVYVLKGRYKNVWESYDNMNRLIKQSVQSYNLTEKKSLPS